jgi:hypothetical protein
MKPKQLTFFITSSLLIAIVFLNLTFPNSVGEQTLPDVYVGIAVGYGIDESLAKSVIDQVSPFTNFFVLGTSGLSRNLTRLNETLQYAYDKSLYFMSFPPPLGGGNVPNATKVWLNYTKNNWGNHLVGFLYPYEDEPGGHQLDSGGRYLVVPNMTKTNYTDASMQFTNSLWFLDLNRTRNLTNYPLFTSDYALYWFDYKGGYDGLFAEFGWNYSRSLNVALCRGAAAVQNKEWGVIITHTYTAPPYIESGVQLYKDLIYAYDNGAKYIVVLDTNVDWTASTLTNEHYEALRQFWQYIKNNPRKTYSIGERTAYALPEGYAYGFRGPLDKIWGIWEADMTSFMLSISVGIMFEKYGSKLDIIYEDALQSGNTYGYSNIIYWNDPTAVSDEWPSSWPLISYPPTQTSSPPPPQNESSNVTSSPSPDPSPSPSQSSSLTLPTPSQLPSSSSEQEGFYLPMNYVYALFAGVACAALVGAIFVFRKKFLSNSASKKALIE